MNEQNGAQAPPREIARAVIVLLEGGGATVNLPENIDQARLCLHVMLDGLIQYIRPKVEAPRIQIARPGPGLG